MTHYANPLEIDVFVCATISSMMSCFTHTCRHLVCWGLQLTSCGSSGTIIGASSALGERAGDEDSLFSHSVRPGALSPVSRKERFSSLMLVWCLTISSGGEVSYSSRSIMTQGDEARAARRERRPCFMYATVACISNTLPQKNVEKHKNAILKRSGINQCRLESTAL